MGLMFEKAAVLGATGPTGKFLVRELIVRRVPVRAVSRSEANLARAFGALKVERVAVDLLDADATRRAIEGCDLVFDCIGLPMDRMADHPRTAKNIASAIASTGARCMQVSGYWAYIPIQRNPVSEDHPRVNGSTPARMRREAEDILLAAGGAVANLPDFYGPEVHTSTLQQALIDAVAGRTVNWIGSIETPREYVYVPDAMKAVAALALREEAYGGLWIVPGAGPIPLRKVLEIAGQHLGGRLKARAAGPLMLRMVGLFVRQLREFMPMVPTYLAPISFDGNKLRALIGDIPVTPYEEAIPITLDWLARQDRSFPS